MFRGFDVNRIANMIMSYHGSACVALADDGRPVAIAGIREVFPALGVAWALATPRFKEQGREIARTCIKAVRSANKNGMTLQAYSWDHNSDGVRWLESLKFKNCGALPEISGEPFTLYERAA